MMHRSLIGHYQEMRKIDIEEEVGNFLSQLIAEVQLEHIKFQTTLLNTGCSFYLGKSVPHKNLISTAFLNESLHDHEINIYISSSTNTFNLATSRIGEIVNQLHPTLNKHGEYRFSSDPSGKFVYVYSTLKKTGGIWVSPTVNESPEMLITPFRTLVSWILEEEGGVILHASSFTVNGRNILLTGPSGSGKSTIAFEALTHSEEVMCDDAIALTSMGCFPIYGKMKMKSVVDSIEISGSQFKCEQVGSKSVLNLTQFSAFRKNWIRPDFLIFPSLSFKSEFIEISMNETIKKIVNDSFSETLGSPIGALKLINASLSEVRKFNWGLDPDPNLNWEELKMQVSRI